MTEKEMEEYKALAQKALNEPDPKKALDLMNEAMAMGKKLKKELVQNIGNEIWPLIC